MLGAFSVARVYISIDLTLKFSLHRVVYANVIITVVYANVIIKNIIIT